MSLPTILGTIGVLITLKSLWILIAPATVRKITLRFCKDEATLKRAAYVSLVAGIVLLAVAMSLR